FSLLVPVEIGQVQPGLKLGQAAPGRAGLDPVIKADGLFRLTLLFGQGGKLDQDVVIVRAQRERVIQVELYKRLTATAIESGGDVEQDLCRSGARIRDRKSHRI